MSAEVRHQTEPRLRLLLLLSALIAGMTGLIAGQPAVAREPAAVAAALSGAVERAQDPASVRLLPAAAYTSAVPRQEGATLAALAPQTHPVDERRLE